MDWGGTTNNLQALFGGVSLDGDSHHLLKVLRKRGYHISFACALDDVICRHVSSNNLADHFFYPEANRDFLKPDVLAEDGMTQLHSCLSAVPVLEAALQFAHAALSEAAPPGYKARFVYVKAPGMHASRSAYCLPVDDELIARHLRQLLQPPMTLQTSTDL